MSGVNETTFLVQQESFDCKCGLNESVIMMNIGVSVIKLDNNLVKNIIC